MSLRRLALLALVLLAAGVYYYTVDVRGSESRAQEEAEAKKLFRFDVDGVAAVELRRADETIRVVRRDGAWRVVAPLDERGDRATMSGLLSTLEGLTPTRALENTEDLSEFGLTEPVLTLVAEEADGDQLAVLYVGDTNPAYTERFVRAKDGATVGLIPIGTYDLLAKELFDVRFKQWTGLTYAGLTFVRLQRRDEFDVRVSRDGEGWVLDGPTPKRADQFVVQSLVSRLLNGRAVKFIDDADPEAETYGLTAPAYVVTAVGEGTQTEIRFGDTVPDSSPEQRYAAVAGETRILVVNSSMLDTYPTSPAELRDKRILGFSRGSVQKISLQGGDDPISLTRDPTADDAWQLDGPETFAAAPSEVNALLDSLARLEATGFLGVEEESVQPANFESAAVTVDVWLRDQAEVERIQFAQGEASDTWYALRRGDPEVYPVPAWQVRVFQVGRAQLRDKRLLRFELEAVHRIEVRVSGREATYTRRGDNAWRPGPGAAQLAGDRIDQLLADLADLQFQYELSVEDARTDGPPALAVMLRDASGGDLGTVRAWGYLERDGARLRTVEARGVVAAADDRVLAEWTEALTGAGG